MPGATVWAFVVWALGAHNGHSFVAGVAIDRIVMPTKDVCEAARHGIEEYLAGEKGALYEPGPCEPLSLEQPESPAPDPAGGQRT